MVLVTLLVLLVLITYDQGATDPKQVEISIQEIKQKLNQILLLPLLVETFEPLAYVPL